jgi:hypothetical protein
VRVGGRREGAKERAVGHSAAATAAVVAVVMIATYDTLPPSAFLQVNGYIPPYDAMRILPRHHASRGGQCASRELLGSFGRQLPTDYREARYITRMCPFRPRSRHMQQIPGQYWKLVFSTPNYCPVLMSGTCGVWGSMPMLILCVLTPSLSLHCSAKRRRVGARKEG